MKNLNFWQFILIVTAWGALIFSIQPALTYAQNWPEFRGPTADGHADSAKLPTKFDASTIQWELPIHGKGWSSPVIWDNQVWLTTATEDGKQMSVICVDLESGKKLHDFVLFANEEPAFCHPTNSYASCTPAIEEGKLYLHFGSYGTACVDTKTAEVIWKRRDLECDHFRGPASSPILFENLMIVAYDGADQQYVVAMDKTTGENVWKTNREIDYGTENGDFKKAYSTGSIFEVDGKPLLVYPSAIATVAYDPKTGEQIWILNHGGMNVSARPIMTDEGLVILTNGMGKMLAVNPQGSGDISDSHVVWQASKAVPRKSSQLIVDGLMYMNEDKGILSCVEAKTGTKVWRERVGGTFAASPLYANGKIYFFSGDGKILVVTAGRTFELVAEAELGDGFKASPAVSGNRMVLRSLTKLYGVEQK